MHLAIFIYLFHSQLLISHSDEPVAVVHTRADIKLHLIMQHDKMYFHVRLHHPPLNETT